jgi:membrane dipeptidase
VTPVPVLDGHNDVLLRLRNEGVAGFLDGSEHGHLDLPRARSGGFAAGLFAVFVRDPVTDRMMRGDPPSGEYALPLPPPVELEIAAREAAELVELLFALEAASDGAVRVARSAADVEAAIAGEHLAAILHFEGAEPIDPELRALEPLVERGLRSLGLVWSRPNAFAEGVPFRFPSSPDTGPGLTSAGVRLVRRCNELGVLVDLSHLNERGFWEVARMSTAPLVASHSNAHALCHSTRNLTGAQLHAIAASGGLVGICFGTSMLRGDGGVGADTPLEALLLHVDYLVDRMGVDHVALGSDFDGTAVPDALAGADRLPTLLDALRSRGYTPDDVRKIAHGNWLRVLRDTWQD